MQSVGGASDVPLLRSLLVARIEERVDHDGDEQDQALDDVLYV